MQCTFAQELESDGVDASLVLRAGGHPSPFTYIIVDKSGAWMMGMAITCLGKIHSSMELASQRIKT